MSSENRPVCYQTIAWEAGVSKSTVCRALKNDPRISAKVREKVQEIAERLGYRPDPQMSKLMEQVRLLRERRIPALLAFILPTEEYPHEYGREIVRGATARAEKLGFSVNVFRSGLGRKEVSSLTRVLRARGADGVLFFPRHEVEPPPQMSYDQLAAVSCAQFSHDMPIHQVSPGHFENMRLLLEELQRRKCLRPALVTWEDFERRQRWAPRMTLYHYYLDVAKREPPPVFDWHQYGGDLARPFLRWYSKIKPDALLVVGPVLVDAVRSILRSAKIRRLPIILSMGHTPAGYAGIDEKPYFIGSSAVDMLTSHIIRNEKGLPQDIKVMTLPGQIRLPKAI